MMIRPKLFYWKFKPFSLNSILHLVVTDVGVTFRYGSGSWAELKLRSGTVQMQACILGKRTGNVAMHYTSHQTIFFAVY